MSNFLNLMCYILMYEIAKPTIFQQTTDGAWKHI